MTTTIETLINDGLFDWVTRRFPGTYAMLTGYIPVEITELGRDEHDQPAVTVTTQGCIRSTYTVPPSEVLLRQDQPSHGPEVLELRIETSHCTVLTKGAGATLFEATAVAFKLAAGTCPHTLDGYVHSAKRVPSGAT